jgi:hypothetical protein
MVPLVPVRYKWIVLSLSTPHKKVMFMLEAGLTGRVSEGNPEEPDDFSLYHVQSRIGTPWNA